MFNSALVNLPTPTSISYMWNWGSLLGLILVVQILSGLILASYYNSSIYISFESIIHMKRNVNFGFLMQFMHMNMASIFFILIFIHISRGMLFSSFKFSHTWMSGTTILLILMATAFLGYVLPWGQMSFWGATVITNLVSAIPYLGLTLVQWLWGGFSIGMATLSRFFMLHFLLPFILMALTMIHLMSLHQTGSNNPVGSNPNYDKSMFHPYFTSKDLITMIIMIMVVITTSNMLPFSMGDPENFNPANPLNTPTHIQPEWYFLFAYAILRSIPNKLGGVLALLMSIMSLMLLPMMKKKTSSKKWMPNLKTMFWMFSANFIILTWIGANVVEPPFESTGKIFSLSYFFFLSLM